MRLTPNFGFILVIGDPLVISGKPALFSSGKHDARWQGMPTTPLLPLLEGLMNFELDFMHKICHTNPLTPHNHNMKT